MTHQVKVGPHGRIVIPADMRRSLGIHQGDALLVTLDDGRLILENPHTAARRGRGSWRGLVGARDLVDELIAERRAEAALEDAEAAGDDTAISRARHAIARPEKRSPVARRKGHRQ